MRGTIGNRLIRITTTLDNGQVAKKEFDYDSYTYQYHTKSGIDPNTGQLWAPITYNTSRGNVTEIRDYDFGTIPTTYGNGTPGALLRRIDKTYLHVSNANYVPLNIVDKVLQSTTFDGSSAQLAQTQYEYDNYVSGTNALVATSGVPKHDYTGYPSTFTLRGNITRVKRWRNTDGQLLTTTYTYDDLGNILTVTDPLGRASNYDYTDSWSGTGCLPSVNSHAYATTFTNAVNQQNKASYFACTGLPQSMRDQNDINSSRPGTTFTYDFLGRLTQKNLADGGQTSSAYNDVPPVSVTATTKITGTLNMVAVAIKDGLGRTTQTQLTSDPDGTTYADTSNDALGRTSTASNPYRAGTSSTDGTTQYTYDPLGRITLVTQPDGSIVTTSYVANTTTVTDEAGKSRKSQVDGLGRLTSVWEDPSGLNYETDYTYNALGDLLTVNQRGNDPNLANWRTRTFSYNSLSQLLSAVNPESGTITYGYDNDGNLLSKTSPSPNQTNPNVTQSVNFCYDAINRLTSKWYTVPTCGQSSPVANYLYDQTSYNGITITNGIGRRTGMSDVSGSTAWSYDSVGRPVTKRQTISTFTKSTGYTYNFDGTVATISNPGVGRVMTYTTNGADRVTTVKNTGGGINFVQNAHYAPFGGLTSATQGASPITIANSFNKRLQPVLISASSPSGNVFSLCYDFHLGGGINAPPCVFSATTAADDGDVFQVVNNRDSNRTQNFTYDSLNRIQTAYTSGPNWGESIGSAVAPGGIPSIAGIDAWGNLWQRSQITGKTNYEGLNCPANNKNQLTACSLNYDAAGNIILNATAAYTYDAENRLATAGGYTYTYDGDGNRVKKTNGSTGTLYYLDVNGNVLNESSLGATNLREYVYMDGRRIARIDVPTPLTVKYYFSDNLGSASVITDASGTVPPLEESDYYPFGGEIPIINGDPNTYKFTSKERDQESGLDFFGARHYASSLGRWVVPDWAAKPATVPYAVFGNPQSLNLYSYVGNNPLLHADVDGHCWPAQSCYQAIANAVDNFSNKVFNNAANSSPTVAALKTFGAGVLASTVKMAVSPLTTGTATGTCMGGSGCSPSKTALAIGGDVLKGAAIAAPLGAVGSKVAGALEATTTTTTVTHFTNDVGVATISESGTLRAGTYVTTPGQISSDATSGQVESILEIGEGKGANSITFETPSSNLEIPENGPTTSGRAQQFQLKEPTDINPADFKKTK